MIGSAVEVEGILVVCHICSRLGNPEQAGTERTTLHFLNWTSEPRRSTALVSSTDIRCTGEKKCRVSDSSKVIVPVYFVFRPLPQPTSSLGEQDGTSPGCDSIAVDSVGRYNSGRNTVEVEGSIAVSKIYYDR